MNNHVTSKEISEKLKSLGVKQESLFWWDDDGKLCIGGEERMGNTLYPETMSGGIYSILSAFLCSELGEMMSELTEKNLIKAYGYAFNVPETRIVTAHGLRQCMANPDIGGKMLIYLLENGLITLN